jgi:hypothetical protein
LSHADVAPGVQSDIRGYLRDVVLGPASSRPCPNAIADPPVRSLVEADGLGLRRWRNFARLSAVRPGVASRW